MLVLHNNYVEVGFFSYVNAFFCSNKYAQMVATWVKTHYTLFLDLDEIEKKNSCGMCLKTAISERITEYFPTTEGQFSASFDQTFVTMN